MARSALILAVLAAGLCASANASARVRGEIGFESRWFEGDGIGRTADFNLGPYSRLELKTRRGPARALGRVFARHGFFEPGRTVVVLEELWAGWRGGGWKFRAGAQLFNWTATEAFHPADILNSRNFDSNVESAEKIGEPSLRASRAIGPGVLEAFFFPVRMSPRLPGGASRLSLTGSEVGDALWVSDTGALSRSDLEAQGGLRAAATTGSADWAVHLVRHRDRSQPVSAVDPRNLRPTPVYLPVTQFGGTYQQAFGPSLLKLEFAWRDFDNPAGSTRLGTISREDHGQIAAGLELGWDSPSGWESAVVLEGQRLFGVDRATRAGLHLFQNDFLIGLRHAFNDAQSRELFASFLFDAERRAEYLWSFRYSQRVLDAWSVAAGARIIQAPQKAAAASGLEVLRAADQIHLTFARHF
jgi:hypothetical protein